MSFDALAWAAKQNPGSSGTKLVLLGLAECADRSHGLAFPSVAALVEFSSLDRKSVIANLDRLTDAGFITDTGRKVGVTKQIKVYQLNLEAVPKTGQSQKRNGSENSDNSPKNGTRNKSEPVTKGAKAPYEAVGELWNSLSPDSGIPEIRVWNNSRKQMLNARAKEHGLDAILDGVRKIHRSKFCRGLAGDGRKQDIMLLLQPKTCPRVLEGFYGEDEIPKYAALKSPEEARDWYLDNAACLEKWGRPDDAARSRAHAKAIEEANPKLQAKVISIVGQLAGGMRVSKARAA